MFIENLTNRERLIALIAVTLFAAAAAYGLVIEPVFLRWRTLTDEIESKAAMAAKDKILLTKHKAIEEERIKYPQFLRTAKSEDVERAKVLDEIEKISKKSSCNISNVKPRESRETGNYKEIFFDVTAEGSINDFSRFLYEIETSSEFLRIKRFIITSKTGPAAKLKGTFIISKIIIAK